MNRLLIALLWTALVIAACAWPNNRLPVRETAGGIYGIKHLDKVVHVAIFCGFGFLWVRVAGVRANLFRLIVAGVVLSVGSELIQLIPAIGRDAGLDDFAADIVGLGLGLAAGLLVPDPGRSPSVSEESKVMVGELAPQGPDPYGAHDSSRSKS